jgi:iron complex outermembrane receptor protein
MVNPVKNLQIGGNFGFTEAKYVDFKPNLSDTVNLKDFYLPFIPRYTLSSFVGYKVNFKSEYVKSAFAHLSVQGIGKQFWNDDNSKSQGAYTIVNGTIGIENQWGSISLWSKNMLNEKYFPYLFYVTNFKNWYAQKGHPVTFGITLSVNISEKN